MGVVSVVGAGAASEAVHKLAHMDAKDTFLIPILKALVEDLPPPRRHNPPPVVFSKLSKSSRGVTVSLSSPAIPHLRQACARQKEVRNKQDIAALKMSLSGLVTLLQDTLKNPDRRPPTLHQHT